MAPPRAYSFRNPLASSVVFDRVVLRNFRTTIQNVLLRFTHTPSGIRLRSMVA